MLMLWDVVPTHAVCWCSFKMWSGTIWCSLTLNTFCILIVKTACYCHHLLNNAACSLCLLWWLLVSSCTKQTGLSCDHYNCCGFTIFCIKPVPWIFFLESNRRKKAHYRHHIYMMHILPLNKGLSPSQDKHDSLSFRYFHLKFSRHF